MFDYNTEATAELCMLDCAGDVVQRDVMIDNSEHHLAAERDEG